MATRAAQRSCAALALLTASLLVACGTDAPEPNTADRTFLARMIPHHERAIAVARIGISDASDPRVRTFASRIVREQTPELNRMRTAAKGLDLDLTAGARMAHDRIADAAVTQLRGLRGAAFDRQFLRLHITSETGAAEMAEQEIHGGRDNAALDIAKPIATAPSTQIPELRRLLVTLG